MSNSPYDARAHRAVALPAADGKAQRSLNRAAHVSGVPRSGSRERPSTRTVDAHSRLATMMPRGGTTPCSPPCTTCRRDELRAKVPVLDDVKPTGGRTVMQTKLTDGGPQGQIRETVTGQYNARHLERYARSGNENRTASPGGREAVKVRTRPVCTGPPRPTNIRIPPLRKPSSMRLIMPCHDESQYASSRAHFVAICTYGNARQCRSRVDDALGFVRRLFQ